MWMSSFVCAGEYAEQLISSQLAESSGMLQVRRKKMSAVSLATRGQQRDVCSLRNRDICCL